jgi:simple sugar transport system ATP-binding protein
MSVTRNFFMGREPVKGIWPFRNVDFDHCDEVTREEMHKIGIDVRDPHQAVGTLSGGERQCVAIARAVYFGAKVLILDEPTSALGVAQTAQTSMVLKYIHQVRQKGLGVIFITHNVRHAYAVGDRFTVLNRGKTLGTYKKSEIQIEELQNLMTSWPAARSCRRFRKNWAGWCNRGRSLAIPHGVQALFPPPCEEGLRVGV